MTSLRVRRVLAGMVLALTSAVTAPAQVTADSAARKALADSISRTLRAADSARAMRAYDSARMVRVERTPDGSRGPLVIPALFYTPETGVGGGIGALWVRADRDGVTRPSSFSTDALATAKGQFTLGAAGDIWTTQNRWHLTYDATLSKFPYRFFGIGETGNDTGETYTPTNRLLFLTAQRLVAPGIYVGARVGYDDVIVTDVAPGSILSRTRGRDGWKLVTVGLLVNRDTRDRLFWPSNGTFASVSLSRASARLGSSDAFSRLTVDARRYFTITGDHILATQAWADLTDGAVPFDRLPQVGGGLIARGYLTGRFRDQQAVALQAEYRSPGFAIFEEVKRFAVVAFAALGSTAPVIGNFSADQSHFAGGVGFRFALALPDRYNFRVDYGFGRDSRALYLTVGESF